MEKTSIRELIGIILKSKLILLVSTMVILIIGLFVYRITPKEYISSVDVTPTAPQENTAGGALGNLANLAGLNAQNQQGGVNVSLYDAIVSSTPFLKDLIDQKIKYHEDSVYLKDYLSQKMIMGFKAKLRAFFHKNTSPIKPSGFEYLGMGEDLSHPMFLRHLKVISLTGTEATAIGILRQKIIYTVSLDKPVEITVSLQDPQVSAQVAVLVVILLSEYVEDFQYNKEKDDMTFLQQEADSAKRVFYAAQNALAFAQDNNRGLVSAIPQAEISRLSIKYQMAQGIYTNIVGKINDLQYSQDKKKPAFIVIEPPQALSINSPSSPRLSIYIILSIVIGGLTGIAIIVCKSFFKTNLGKENKLDPTGGKEQCGVEASI